jgi:hypothetical protein
MTLIDDSNAILYEKTFRFCHCSFISSRDIGGCADDFIK